LFILLPICLDLKIYGKEYLSEYGEMKSKQPDSGENDTNYSVYAEDNLNGNRNGKSSTSHNNSMFAEMRFKLMH